MTISVVACPSPVLQFFDNRGNPLVGGTLLTQVGGVNYPTYQDSGGTTALPNPITLNSRGEVADATGTSRQLFVVENTIYTFTLSDASGNQIWSEPYVNGVQLTAEQIAALLDAVIDNPILESLNRTAAEQALSVTPSNYSYPPYTLMRYGADPTGASDSTTALQTALNCASQAKYATVRVGIGAATLKIGSAWTIDTNTTGIDFEGAYIDASSFATGHWMSPTQSNTDVNMRPLLNNAHPIKNLTVKGPGTANTAAIAFYLSDPDPLSGTYNCSGMSFYNVNTLDWGQDVTFNNGAFCINFTQCSFGSNSGTATTYSVSALAGSNGGERNTFVQCFWFNKGLLIDQNNGSGETHLIGCSLDMASRAIYCQSGVVIIDDCHVETGDNTDYQFYCTGTNSRILGNDIEIVFDVARTKPFGYSDSSCTWGGIFLDRIAMSAASGYGVALIDGTGNTKITNYIGLGTASGHPSFLSAAQDMNSDPNFSGNSLSPDGWTASGNGPPATTNANGYNGSSYSVEFNGITATYADLTSQTYQCRPGEQAFAEVYAMLPTWATGGAFTCVAKYVDKAGVALSSVIGATTGAGFQFMNITTTQSSYAQFSTATSGGLGRAPPGTVGFVLSFSAGGATVTGYLGQVRVTIG